MSPSKPTPESLPPEPDPGKDFAEILAWLMKLNGTAKLSKCKEKWEKHLEQEIPVEDFIERLEQRDCFVVIIPRKGGRIQKKYVMLTEKGWTWAAKWTHYYNVDIPHHRHFKKLKE
jgi:hypothetical protein